MTNKELLIQRLESAFVLAVIAAVAGGSTAVTAKIALEVFHPFTLIALRFFCASLFLLPFIVRSDEFNFKSLKHFFPVCVVGAFNPILLFIALQYTQASVSPLIYACVPALTALYFYFSQGKRLNLAQTLGIVVGLAGVALIVLLPLFELEIGISALRGNGLIFLAAIAFMVYGIMSKQKQKEIMATPIALTFYFSLITLLASLPFAVREFVIFGTPENVAAKHVVSGVLAGVVGTGIFYLSYQQALKLSSEVAANLFTYLQPIATIVMAALFLGENVTVSLLIGGLLAVVGARVATKTK